MESTTSNRDDHHNPVVPSPYDYATLYEEWLQQHHHSETVLKSPSKEPNNSINDKNVSYAKALVARAGRLGTIQCAIWDSNNQPNNNGWMLRGRMTLMELDDDGEFDNSNNNNVELPNYVVAANSTVTPTATLAPRRRQQEKQATIQDMMTSTCSNTMELALENVHVDAFFDEYPECVRTGWDAAQAMGKHSSDDEEDDGDDENHDEPGPQRKKQSLLEVAKHTTEAATQTTEQHPLNSQQPASVTAESFLYSQSIYQDDWSNNETNAAGTTGQQPTQTTDPQPQHYHPRSNQMPQYQNQHHQDQPPPPPNHHPNANPTPHYYDHSNHYDHHYQLQNNINSNVSNNNTNQSWEDYHRDQNPFQTARELAHANPQYHNPYQQNPQQQQQPQNQQNQEAILNSPTVQGPVIRESLKRKFQPPTKRAGNAAANTSSNNNNNNNSSTSNGGVRQLSKALLQKKNNNHTSGGKENYNNSNNIVDAGGDGNASGEEDDLPEELKRFGKELVDKIKCEIMYNGEKVTFDDIAGLEDAKSTIQEIVCWPMRRPDLFTGLRRTPNGLLLFGPPGTGKTLIGKAIAHESGATFFSISSSSLTSKWIGEGEKLVKTLFGVASFYSPAVVFIDEIDSLLTQRKSDDNEASRRIKTEFLVQLDGTGTSGQGRVLVIGATNRPQELDEAARRRFVKRLYIPLPDESDRACLLRVLLKTNAHTLTEEDILKVAADTKGFSGADLAALSADAAMGPIRQLGLKALDTPADQVPPISFRHFRLSLKGMHPSVSADDITHYEVFDNTFGSKRASSEENCDDEDSVKQD